MDSTNQIEPLVKSTPYSESHVDSTNYHPYSPHYSPMTMGPGYTLLRGHIKLMAMVPNLPENQVTSKPWSHNPASPFSSYSGSTAATSSQSLPPITPRMMPSISQKYWRPLHYFPTPPFKLDEKSGSPPSGYYTPPPMSHPSMWQSQKMSSTSLVPSPFHPQSSLKPFQNTYPGQKQNLFDEQQNEFGHTLVNQSYMDPQHWHASQMAYQMMNQQSYHTPPCIEYPYHQVYPEETSPHFYPASPHQVGFPPNYMYPYSQHLQHHQQFPAYPHQDSSYFINESEGAYIPNHSGYDHLKMFPPQHLQVQQEKVVKGRRASRTIRRSNKIPSGKEEEKEMCIVIEEEEISSSSSLSSTEENEIRKKETSANSLSKENENQASQLGNASTMNPNEGTPQDTVSSPLIPPAAGICNGLKEEKEIPTNDVTTEPLSSKQGKKGTHPILVTINDCFLSSSSEPELDQEQQTSELDCLRKIGKKKPGFMKNARNAAITESFEDLDKDLNLDEARAYTCEYIVDLLSSQDWHECCFALQIIIRMARHRPQNLLNYLQENAALLWGIFNHLTSPKSALCRSAVVTFKELFERIPGALDNHLDKITEKLVVKSLAPNNFIRVECEKALMAMIEHANLVKVLIALEHMRKKSHNRAAPMKMALARMALLVVQTAGVDLCLMNSSYAEKLLPMLFCFMMEPNSGIRSIAKNALGKLMNHLQFESAVLKHVTFDRNATEVFKKLEKLRDRGNKITNISGNRIHHQKTYYGSSRIFVAK